MMRQYILSPCDDRQTTTPHGREPEKTPEKEENSMHIQANVYSCTVDAHAQADMQMYLCRKNACTH